MRRIVYAVIHNSFFNVKKTKYLLAYIKKLVYNTKQSAKIAGVWCNGSTEASDSSGVSSILTTPAKKYGRECHDHIFLLLTYRLIYCYHITVKNLLSKNIIVFLLVALIAGLIPLGLTACEEKEYERDYAKDPLTLEEIEQWTQQKCFDENGNANKYIWHESNLVLKEKRIWDYQDEDITGFTVYMVNGFDGDPGWFLVEFEPFGHYFGNIYKGHGFYTFSPYPSPFKILGIPYEEAYVLGYTSQRPDYGRKQYGLIFSVFDDAYANVYVPTTYFPQYNSFGDLKGMAYDQSLKKWIELGIEEETGRLYRIITDSTSYEVEKDYLDD